MSSTPPKIAVIGCGGTITSVAESNLEVLDYPEFGEKLPAQAVLARFPEVQQFAEIFPVAFRNVGSTAIEPPDWFDLRALIQQLATENLGISGFVVLHGTATLEETAFFLNLTLKVHEPVVVVGAQRPASAVSSDAEMNLIDALRVAGSYDAKGKGVLVVLNDEIHAARDVIKTSTYRLQTFRSLDFGALGHVDGDGVHFYRAPLRRHAPNTEFASQEDLRFPRVDIIYSYAGADGALIDAAAAAGAAGLVLASLPPGISTPSERAAVKRALDGGIVVVQCTRAPSGRVAPRRYLRESGIIAGDDLSPQKARILLGLLLGSGRNAAHISAAFQAY